MPRLPPSICGIGDYTLNLLAHFPDPEKILLLVQEGSSATKKVLSQYEVDNIPSSGKSLVQFLNQRSVSHLIVQYSGYGFDSCGAPIDLLRAIRAWKVENPTVKLVLMAHELWHNAPLWKLQGLRQVLHKQHLSSLAACADHVFTSTPGYTEWLAPFVDGYKLRTLPVGSNIIPIRSGYDTQRNRGQWVLFGRQGSRVVALNALGTSLTTLQREGLLDRLLVVGSTDGQQLERDETKALSQYLPNKAYVRFGALPNEEISKIFLQSEFGILGQNPNSYTKSTVLMAYAAHGVIPVISTVAIPTHLSCGWIKSVDEILAMNPVTANFRLLHEEVLAWHQQTGGWNYISRAYIEAMTSR